MSNSLSQTSESLSISNNGSSKSSGEILDCNFDPNYYCIWVWYPLHPSDGQDKWIPYNQNNCSSPAPVYNCCCILNDLSPGDFPGQLRYGSCGFSIDCVNGWLPNV